MQIPDFIQDEKIYKQWLYRKARSHYERDKKYVEKDLKTFRYTYQDYKNAIHKAVLDSKGVDCYTGEMLEWSLIGKWNNKEAKTIGYKKKFKNLPTLEHVDRANFADNFAICSWSVNDTKNDLSKDEFVELCKKVIKHIG